MITLERPSSATGLAADGRREAFGFDVGDSKDGAFWAASLLGLKAWGPSGGAVVIFDAHVGLKAAVEAVLISAV